MQVLMAIAKENFIDVNDSPNFSTNDNFIEAIKKIFNFQNVDILEFDGNKFQMINSYDPTNSMFIYTNQQGTFLYTVTEASPRIHKNNMIWDCYCYKMEDVAKIEDILANNKVTQAIMYKNIAPFNSYLEADEQLKLKQYTPEYIIEEKENFKTQEIYKQSITSITSSNYWCFKLKFTTNPTADNTLITKEEDGSFNFFFPLWNPNYTISQQDPNYLFPLKSPGYRIYDETVTPSPYLSLQDIITKYSTNLKSVEFIPFFPYGDDVLGASIGVGLMQDGGETIVKINSYSNGAKWTDAGIFFPYGHTTKQSAYNQLDTQYPGNLGSIFSKMALGGGIRGKLFLPNGEIPINFNSFKLSTRNQTNEANLYIKSEGWKIDGLFEVDAPPLYLNFYTDERGQLFIQNLTSNAQELREINRDYDNKRSQMGISRSSNLIGDIISNAFRGNIGGIFGAIGNQALGFSTDLAKFELDYNKAKATFEDKVRTQSLLAQMTGKTISGNCFATDLITNLSKNSYLLIFELNYSIKNNYNSSGTPQSAYYVLQQNDYDYSVSYYMNKDLFNNNKYCMVLNRTNRINPQYEYDSISNFIKSIFGYGSSYQYDWLGYNDSIGLNYSVVFKLENLPAQPATNYGTIPENLKNTLILSFPIRHKKKYSAT